MKIAFAALVALSAATPALAEGSYQPGWSEERTCFKTEYREEYIPGTEDHPGYVKSWKDTLEVPCEDSKKEWRRHPHYHNNESSRNPKPSYRSHVTVYEDVDPKDCSE